MAAIPASEKSSRNYGIDVLRILAMFCVVLLHEGSHGGLIEATDGLRHSIVMLAMAASYCAVDCFVMITGYCQVRLHFKSRRLLSLWTVALFYSIAATLFTLVANVSSLPEFACLKMFFPVLSNCWWFFTAYVGLMLVSPFVNVVFTHIDEGQTKLLLGVCLLAFCVAPFLVGGDIFKFGGGYTFAWFVVLYAIGGCLRVLNPLRNWKLRWLATYAAFVAVCWLLEIGTESGLLSLALFPGKPWAYLTYLSPFVLGSGISILMFFSRLRIERPWMQFAIKWVTPSVFAVYLISDHVLIRNAFMKNALLFSLDYRSWQMVLIMIGFALAVFVACVLIDKTRALVFKILRIDKGIAALGGLIDARLSLAQSNPNEASGNHR